MWAFITRRDPAIEDYCIVDCVYIVCEGKSYCGHMRNQRVEERERERETYSRLLRPKLAHERERERERKKDILTSS